MKHTLEELNFLPCKDLQNTEEASLKLKNGYIVHVKRGTYALHTYGAPYELFLTPICAEITEDSVGYLSEEELFKLINEIENLQKLK